uniref:tRNA (guanosine(18)-2'-O)-methyltransferase TARBP1 n=1 Tax=Kalanchoe fedtschenkoi TaxID=63787 RepID=A0A7N0VHV0_KALFE
MPAMEVDSVASHVLCRSFENVPEAAIPAMLDCILSSSFLSPVSLFPALLDSFSDLIKNVAMEDGILDSRKKVYVCSFVGALCHFLKKPGSSDSALTSFVCECFVPLLKVIHPQDHEMLNKTADSLFEVVIYTKRWSIIEEMLVPLFLRSIALAMGLIQRKSLANGRSWPTILPGIDHEITNIKHDDQSNPIQMGTFPLSVSCHILTSLLDAALKSNSTTEHPSNVLQNGHYPGQNIAGNLMWHLCNLTVQSLTEVSDNRTLIISSVLPSVFRAFICHHTFNVFLSGQQHVLSRGGFFSRIWECCKTLFSRGSMERRDAYNILSLIQSISLFHEDLHDKTVRDIEDFDMRSEKEFWEQIKFGLVDKESIVRKQSLHILKTALNIKDKNLHSGVSETTTQNENSVSKSIKKRCMWAEKEAKSMGIESTQKAAESLLNNEQRWVAFLLLYETLEEYGTHLVEAAWNHQITLLVQSVPTHAETSKTSDFKVDGELFYWLPILWERGFVHDNPNVRCLIMHSFLEIDWKTHEEFRRALPESFVLGPFLQALNDPSHHKDFGVKGLHTSGTILAATQFLRQYVLHFKKHIIFLCNLAAAAKQIPFGRAGLMCLAECISAAASGSTTYNDNEAQGLQDGLHDMIETISTEKNAMHINGTKLLDLLRFVIESSKQHFNHNYRLRVCRKILDCAATVVCVCAVDIGALLHFVSSLPREFTDHDGCLRAKIQEWLLGCCENCFCVRSCSTEKTLLVKLYNMMTSFSRCLSLDKVYDTCDDEELEALGYESKRWARLLFLVIKEDNHLEHLLMFIQNHAMTLCMEKNQSVRDDLRFFVLLVSLVDELSIMHDRTASSSTRVKDKPDKCLVDEGKMCNSTEAHAIFERFTHCFVKILGKVVSSANTYCSAFWDQSLLHDTSLPPSVKGKLGGPSQRRLSSPATTSVLLAITSLKAVASTTSLCAQFQGRTLLDVAYIFLWKLFFKIVHSSTHASEMGGEICLAALEALVPVLKTVTSSFSPSDLVIVRDEYISFIPKAEEFQFLFDSLVDTFVYYVNRILDSGILARARRSVLMDCKWHCLESLLSVPFHARLNRVHLDACFYSESTIKNIFCDVVESLENAGEGFILPMLRSLRLILDLFASSGTGLVSYSSDTIDAKMVWQLVRSSWILHVSCKKRRVAPIAALLSSVLHTNLFKDIDMHVMGGEEGPLKWIVRNILEEGTKSPRTMRLAALHLTGLWLLNPTTVKYYIKELKLISLYGSVQFDEDFEAELNENHDAKAEVALLAKSCDPELTQEFINTELYARVSIAALFSKLADMADLVGSSNLDENFRAALESGKLFLLELLQSVVHDKDLSKELYKKYSAIHRRKTRAWQMICVLSRFVREDIVQLVSDDLHICLNRNNMPSVRQYLETFAINVYLKFPSLVLEQLVPILRDYDMKSQALSSYVFIAANIILHANKAVQTRHLNELLPPIVPLLTSHHHSLRGFAQLLVHHVLCKLYPSHSSSGSEAQLEKQCFVDLKFYLSNNLDCKRLRASMEGYLDAFDPVTAGTPAGIFTSRLEVHDFECVSNSLMEQVITFLNDVRDDLRSSMAKDAATIKNESLLTDSLFNTSVKCNGTDINKLPKDSSFNFQKKITHNKLESVGADVSSFNYNREGHCSLLELENEDQLLEQLLQSRCLASEKMREGQQSLVIVASLLDRIPNLAGLARTCEVFKAESLAIADINVLQDKQFQLISVTAEKWVPIIEVPVNSLQIYLEKKKRQGFSILGLEQTANSVPLDQFSFPKKTVLVLGREKEGIPVDIIHILDACIEIPQLGVVRSLNVHVSGAIAIWEYTRQQRAQ